MKGFVDGARTAGGKGIGFDAAEGDNKPIVLTAGEANELVAADNKSELAVEITRLDDVWIPDDNTGMLENVTGGKLEKTKHDRCQELLK